jgi:ribonuclease HII
VKGYAFDRSQLAPAPTSGPTPVLPGMSLEQQVPSILAGVDEAGCGPLAGPVVSAAVILSESPRIRGLNDSKKLTALERERLFGQIMERAVATAVSIVEADVIDSINILGARLHAMRECLQKLSVRPGLVLVDGKQKPGSGFPERAVVKGDTLSASIMAASILAKVTRDRIMVEAHDRYPMYGFDKHKGYACKAHIDAIREHGPCPLHRRSFDPVRTWMMGGLDLLPS